jgi:hypothetical protein
MRNIHHFTHLAFYLNAALDSRKYNDLDVKEAQDHIEDGTIFQFLKARLGNDIQLGFFDAETQGEFVTEWTDMLRATFGERRFGVANNGLCLLIALLLQGIQQRSND